MGEGGRGEWSGGRVVGRVVVGEGGGEGGSGRGWWGG